MAYLNQIKSIIEKQENIAQLHIIQEEILKEIEVESNQNKDWQQLQE